MSQSPFSAVLVGVTALLRRPSLLRGRCCGFCTLASAASRSDFVARGFDFAASRADFAARGFAFAASRADFAARGFDLAASRTEFTARGFDLAASRTEFTARGFAFAASRAAFAARGFAFAASRTEFAARGFGFHGLPPPTCRTAHRRRCPHRESRRGAPITHKFHFKTLIPTC